MSQTVVEKIAQLHMSEGPKRKLRAALVSVTRSWWSAVT